MAPVAIVGDSAARKTEEMRGEGKKQGKKKEKKQQPGKKPNAGLNLVEVFAVAEDVGEAGGDGLGGKGQRVLALGQRERNRQELWVPQFHELLRAMTHDLEHGIFLGPGQVLAEPNVTLLQQEHGRRLAKGDCLSVGGRANTQTKNTAKTQSAQTSLREICTALWMRQRQWIPPLAICSLTSYSLWMGFDPNAFCNSFMEVRGGLVRFSPLWECAL
jgi:hypothetical protein